MRVVPAIDIINGKCVRLEKGEFNTSKVYGNRPLDMALKFQDIGIKHLHVVDLDGAKNGEITNIKTLEELCTKTNLKIDFGGGVQTLQDVSRCFEIGVSQVNIGSMAFKKPDTFIEALSQYGGERIVLAADVKKGFIQINAWRNSTSVSLKKSLTDFVNNGGVYTACTDIEKDGMLKGPSFSLYEEILSGIPNLKLIASGGVSKIQDLKSLEAIGLDGVIIGKAIYEGNINLKELEDYVG